MKAILASLLTVSLVAGIAGQADAASQQQRKRLKAAQAQHSKPYQAKAQGYRAPASSAGESDYYEHILDKVPFGSKRWWSIYDEQHGTPD